VSDYQKFGVGPNGAINSCVDDMLKYLAFHMSDGKVNGYQVISAVQMEALHHPNTMAPSGDPYALGWYIFYRHGQKSLEHGGGVPGFTSNMIILPEEKIGIVVLNNKGSDLPDEITQDILDRLLGFKPVNLVAETKADDDNGRKWYAAQRAKFEAARIPNTKPTLELSAYVGLTSIPLTAQSGSSAMAMD
jgi:CubicO group peptidase (beta-lactamase class C family)